MKKILTLVSVIALIAVMFSPMNAYALEDTFGGFTKLFSSEEESLHVGETETVDGIEATLYSVMEAKGSEDSYQPTAGNVFVLLEFTLKNTTSEVFTVSTVLSFVCECDGTLQELSFDALGLALFSGKFQLDRVIEPDEAIVGVIGYEVPEDWKEILVQFTPEFGSAEHLSFEVTKE